MTNKERDMVITKRINISVCDAENDINESTNRVLKWIESNEFQSWDMKLELCVDTLWRTYDVTLYRDWRSMHVWFDGDFAYEVDLSAGWFKNCIRQLFQNWRWVPWIYMEWHWSQSDPYLQWNTLRANYREVEDYLREDFIDWLKDSNQYDNYNTLKKSVQDKKFNDWLFKNYYKIVEIFLQLRDLNVWKNTH